MKPVDFSEQNKVLVKPEGMTDKECGDLPIHQHGEFCISCWGGGWRDRLRFLFTGKVWLWVWSGQTQPPVKVVTENPWGSSNAS